MSGVWDGAGGGESVKRLWRVTLGSINVLALLLCVATVAFWVRGYFVSDDVSRDATTAKGLWSWSFAHSGRGRLLMVRHTIDFGKREARGAEWEWKKSAASERWPIVAAASGTNIEGWEYAGFSHRWRPEKTLNGLPDTCHWVGVPMWFAVAVTA